MTEQKKKDFKGRLRLMAYFTVLLGGIIIVRLFTLQVWQHNLYEDIAAGKHEVFAELMPDRGTIYITDGSTGADVPVALNADVYTVYAETRKMTDIEGAARAIDDALHIGAKERWELYQKMLKRPDAAYVPLFSRMSEDDKDLLSDRDIQGIGFVRNPYRFYPEESIGAHVYGFYGITPDGSSGGKYGIEGYFEEELRGQQGRVSGERTALGAWIPLGGREYKPPTHGSDVYLTIDRAIQHEVCTVITSRAQEFEAVSATAVVMDPKTGAVRAMCTYPSFDPNKYNETENIDHFNNQTIFTPYEIGSIFKPLVIAAALDQEVITPSTEFEDKGFWEIGRFTIKNAGEKKFGVVTMRQVLVDSINTGMIFVAERLGNKNLKKYLEEYGFGKKVGIKMQTESPGNISSLDKDAFIYTATASYGQGLTATPLQMVQAYSAIANGGKKVKPYIVEKIQSRGKVEYEAKVDRDRILSPRSAAMAADMMSSVIDDGTSWVAGVEGYRLAGKTGTAQIAQGAGYGEKTNQTFVGFGPVEDPQYILLLKFEKPNTLYATYSAAPVFGQLSQFILQYMGIPPSR